MKISMSAIFYVVIPIIAISSLIFSIIQGYLVLNIVYYGLVLGTLGVWVLYGVRHETKEITWKEAMKNMHEINQFLKVERGVTPKIKWGFIRSDMKRFSSTGKVWDIQEEFSGGNAAVLQDARTGKIVGFDVVVGERTSPAGKDYFETSIPPVYTPQTGKKEVVIKEKSETK